jgi:hypothetical protein
MGRRISMAIGTLKAIINATITISARCSPLYMSSRPQEGQSTTAGLLCRFKLKPQTGQFKGALEVAKPYPPLQALRTLPIALPTRNAGRP